MVWAKEDAPPKAEGKEAAPAAAAAPKEEWMEIQANVQALQAKIKSNQDLIKKLIIDKKTMTDKAKLKETLDLLVSTHKQLQKDVKDYEQQRSYLRFRFPEKGFSGQRNYERIEVKSLEEMETQLSLDTRVKQSLGKVRRQYGAPADDKVTTTKEEKSSQEKSKEDSSLTDAVIIRH